MGARRTFSAEYKREAVAMLDAPGVTVSQIAADLGMGANVLGRWQHPSPGKRILQMGASIRRISASPRSDTEVG